MMKLFISILILLLTVCIGFSQNKPAYTLFNAKGKRVSYNKMIKMLLTSDITLFGELHNNPIAHWLQLSVTKELHQSKKLILGAEMMEADNQIPLNAFLQGKIDDKEFAEKARLWPNYKTDYAPLVNFAKENNLHFVASNIPRRYASLVYKNGFNILDSLPETEKKWIAPLPIPFDKDLPNYKKILHMMGDHSSPKLVMAQAIKDATMAYFILRNYKKDHLFIHYNGAYHSDNFEGILWYLKKENKTLNYKTITTVTQKDIKKLSEENKDKADFIICVDADMTTTY